MLAYFIKEKNPLPQIAEGMVAGLDAGIVLSAKQCVALGHHAIAKDFYYQAIDWMATAVNKVMAQADITVDLKEAEAELETAKQVVSQLFNQLCKAANA